VVEFKVGSALTNPSSSGVNGDRDGSQTIIHYPQQIIKLLMALRMGETNDIKQVINTKLLK
jgi:hypothetical protein